MKKIYILFVFVFLLAAQGVAQTVNDWGLFESDRSKITLNLKGVNKTYIVYNGDFDGRFLTYLTAKTDILKSINYGCQTWEHNGAHVTNLTFNYRVYKADAAPGDFISLTGRLAGGSANGDKAWTYDQEINLTDGCEDGTTYIFEFYADFTGTPAKTCQDNNSGSYYKAYFGTSKTFPVELTAFNAITYKNSVKLNWATATEVNNYAFEIERKSETADWQKLGTVAGSGTSSSPKEYSFEDKSPEGGSVLQYRLKQIDNDGLYKYYNPITVNITTPQEFKLLQNFPNPFNPSTSLRFKLAENSFVTLKIFDALGREVATILNEEKPAGTFSVNWNGCNKTGNLAPSGIYYCRMTTEKFVETIKMNLLK